MIHTICARTHAQGLLARSQLAVAVAEKKDAVVLWSNIEEMSQKLRSIVTQTVSAGSTYNRCGTMTLIPVPPSAVVTSAVYGRRLSEIVWSGWSVMAASVAGNKNCTRILDLVARYDRAWAGYTAMHLSYTFTPSLYLDYYWSPVPGHPHLGIGATVDAIRRNCSH